MGESRNHLDGQPLMSMLHRIAEFPLTFAQGKSRSRDE
jgi:hypothetical protein